MQVDTEPSSGIKRKRLTFADNDQTLTDPAPSTTPAQGVYMNPERLAALKRAPSASDPYAPLEPKKKKVKKEKTPAQLRYAKKERDKRKKRVKAGKAAAPKNKGAVGLKEEEEEGSGSESEEEEEEMGKSSTTTAIATPVITKPILATSAYPAVPKPTKKPSLPVPTNSITSTLANPSDTHADPVEDPEETTEQRRERRRLEKKAKREVRRAAEAREAEEAEERERLRVEKEKEVREEKERKKALKGVAGEVEIAEEEDGSDSSSSSSSSESESESESDNESSSSSSSSASSVSPPMDPEGIPTFPLPQAPAAPSPSLLARQGLPAALRDAVLVQEDKRVKLEDMKVQGRVGVEKDGLGEKMEARLKEIGIEEFFAVQTALIPELAALPLVPFAQERLNDYLVSAPTGSGKTLAYAVPIVQVLSKRIVTRLRALIILPTRDLVMQVRETMEELSRGTGLKIGTATGQHSFAQEQTGLVGNTTDKLLGGSSKIDILIATPGRLMEHLRETPNFSLQHLRFLIIDEADRLLTQSFQDWLNQVLAHLKPSEKVQDKAKFLIDRLEKGHDAVTPSWYDDLGLGQGEWEGKRPIKHICQKLLFSATLTRDPGKIAALHLRNPKYFIVGSGKTDAIEASADATGQQFAIPTSLTERMIVLPPDLKPLNLLHLLHSPQFGIKSALCFTKSVDSTERLLRLIAFFEDAYTAGKRLVAKAYSGELDTSVRRRLLAEFAKGEIDVLVCSDLIARGIDLPSVSHVISYDAPVDMRKYVHRVGRTARAGKEGTAWTLVEKQEARHFKQMLSTAHHLDRVKKLKVKETDLASLRDSYDIALGRLKTVYTKNQ